MKRKNYLLIPLVLLIASTLTLQAHYLDGLYGERMVLPECPWCETQKLGEDVIYVPIDSSLMRLFSPADPHFLADLLWLRAAYYFGEHALTNRQYPYLLHLLDLITDLSPQWLFPYLFGAIILGVEADATEEAFYIIDKGLTFHPDSWELWFYKGYYLWQHRADNLGAARALNQSSRLPEAPSYLIRLSATLATQAGQNALALHFLQEALRNVSDPHQRTLLTEKIKTIQDPPRSNPVTEKTPKKEAPGAG